MLRTVSLLWLLSLAACAARPAGEDAGVTTMMGDESGATDQPESSEVGPMTLGTTGDGDGDGDGDGGDGDGDGDGDDSDTDDCTQPIKLDIPSDTDPMPESCTVEWIEWPTPEQWPGCEICEWEDWCFSEAYLACVTPTPGQTCADLCPSGDCIGSSWLSCEGNGPSDDLPTDTCGHYEIDGKCCTIGKFFAACVE
jgi:hypothetical protein